MNFQTFLQKLLDIANFGDEKKKKFTQIFYQYYYVRLIDAIGGIDPMYAQRLTTAVDNIKTSPEQFADLWKELRSSDEFSKVIDQVTDEVIGYLLDDVIKSSDDSEKAQIIAALGVGASN